MRPSTIPSSLYKRVHFRPNLRQAWAKVREKGLSSKSYRTREETKKFDIRSEANLNNIQIQLRTQKFSFTPSEGVPQSKGSNKGKRPIVISPTRDRVVRRAILNVLQDHEPIKPFFNTETSFGGIPSRGVPDAIQVLIDAIDNGGKYFIRSDIKSFFTKIPKSAVLAKVRTVVDDDEFFELVGEAMNTELGNLESLLADERALFPLTDIGVAQGSSLSPLAGNILLSDFDIAMNQRDIVCLRYIDDFIILGPTQKAVNAAFKRALKLLTAHELEAYDPHTTPEKAEAGATDTKFSFLGCDIMPGMIQPGVKTRNRLIGSVDELLRESAARMNDPVDLKKRKLSVIDTLSTVNNILMGWGNQYAFCNNDELMRQLDKKIDELIAEYLVRYGLAHKMHTHYGMSDQRRRLLGVHLISDSKKHPIVSAKEPGNAAA